LHIFPEFCICRVKSSIFVAERLVVSMSCVSAWNLPVLEAGGFAPANYCMGSKMLTARRYCHSCSGWWAGADIHPFYRFLLFKPILVFMAPLAPLLPCFCFLFASALKKKGWVRPISIAEYCRKPMAEPLFRERAVRTFASHYQNNVAIPPNDKSSGSSTAVASMPLNNASQAAVSTGCRGFGKGN
jgi:hypothetical protein